MINMQKKETKIINLWGAPGSGKSTAAAGLYYLMKKNNLSVELVTEYAKELIYKNKIDKFKNQKKIINKQEKRIKIYINNVKYVINDSPLPICSFYCYLDQNKTKQESKLFNGYCFKKFKKYININFFLTRNFEFEKNGRRHDEKEAFLIEKKMQQFLDKNNINYELLNSKNDYSEIIYKYIKNLKSAENE